MQVSCLLETKTTLVQLLPPMVTVGSAVIRGWLIPTILFLGVPLYSVKSSPIRILPSGWRVIAQSKLFVPVPGLKIVSKEPSGFRRAIPFLGVPLYSVKYPPIKILPLGWRVVF